MVESLHSAAAQSKGALMRATLIAIVSATVMACGAPSKTSSDLGGMGSGDLAMKGSGGIPRPGTGNGVDNNFGNVEPNDTPMQATPLGVAAGTGVGVWVNNNTIGGADSTDYFVFQSSASGGGFALGSSGICWSGGITGMTATLWKVVSGQEVMPPIHTWNGSGSCVKSATGDATLEASTVYLLGLTATGGAGTYGA
jgi:hypothetical protein